MFPWFSYIFSFITLLILFSPETSHAQSKLKIDDVLSMETYGYAIVDSKNQRVIFEKSIAYQNATDFSLSSSAIGLAGRHLRTFPLQTQVSPNNQQIGDVASHWSLGTRSPDGEYFSYYAFSDGEIRIGVFGLSRNNSVLFENRPKLRHSGQYEAVWLSGPRLAFSAVADDQPSGIIDLRSFTGTELNKRSQATWRGKLSSFSHYNSKDDRPSVVTGGALIVADVDTGREAIIAEGAFVDLRASPTGKLIAALRTDRILDARKNRLRDNWLARKYTLSILDPDSLELIEIRNDLNVYPGTLNWDHEGRRVLFFGWGESLEPRHGSYHVLDTERGKTTKVSHRGLDLASMRERGGYQRPEAGVFVGDKIAVFARPIAGPEETGRFTYQERFPTNLTEPDWYLLDANGNRMNVTSEINGVSGNPIFFGSDNMVIWATDGVFRVYADGKKEEITRGIEGAYRYIPSRSFADPYSNLREDYEDDVVFEVKNSGETRIVALDLSPTSLNEVISFSLPNTDSEIVTADPHAKIAVVKVRKGWAQQLQLIHRDGEAHVINEINSHIKDIGLGQWRSIKYDTKSVNDKQAPLIKASSCILLPPDYEADKRYPVIAWVYPRTRSSCPQGAGNLFDPNPTSPHIWSSKGFIFARISAPTELIRTNDGPIAGINESIDSSITALIEQGYADPERLVMLGFSQGGPSTLYAAAKTDVFGAVISMFGWSNLFSHYFSDGSLASHFLWGELSYGNFGRYETTAGQDFGVGLTVFDDPDTYVRNSPVYLAPHINTPILLVHSDMDIFGMEQSDAMFAALNRLGKDVEYIRYWGEGHGLSSPANIRHLWDSIDRFLGERNIHGGPKKVN